MKPTGKTILICLSLLCSIYSIQAQTIIAAEREWSEIEDRDALYSKYLLEGDSLSIAAMYASDGMMGCMKGAEILSSVGSWIRNGIKNESRHVTFKTKTLTADGELLVETGDVEARNDNGDIKYTSRYLVVWKKEDGVWKLYRDIGL